MQVKQEEFDAIRKWVFSAYMQPERTKEYLANLIPIFESISDRRFKANSKQAKYVAKKRKENPNFARPKNEWKKH